MPIGSPLIPEYFQCECCLHLCYRGSGCLAFVKCEGFGFISVFTFTSIVDISLLIPPLGGLNVAFPASIRCGSQHLWGKKQTSRGPGPASRSVGTALLHFTFTSSRSDTLNAAAKPGLAVLGAAVGTASHLHT